MRRTRAPAPATADLSSADDEVTTDDNRDSMRGPAAPAPGKRRRGVVAREGKRKSDHVPTPIVAPVEGGAGVGSGNLSDVGVGAHAIVDPVVTAL